MTARVRVAWLALTFSVLSLTAVAWADVIHLEDGGKYRGKIVSETSRAVTIETAGGRLVVPRGQIARIVREEDAKETFQRRYDALVQAPDAEAFYELGRWAEEKELPRRARGCFLRAVEADAFHAPSREALGHILYQGRWYSPEEYKREVEGLVPYQDRWVTPQEKDLLEQGFVQDEQGRWVLPGDPTAEPRVLPRPKPKPATPSAREPDQPRKPAPAARRVPAEEDKGWYSDNTRIGDFSSAPEHQSRFYKIKTNIKPEYAARYGTMMDRYYKRFLKVFAEFLPRGEIPKSEIWIYSSQQEFMAAERMGPSTGGFYFTGNKRVTAYHGLFGDNGTTREVLAHEGTHQFEDIVLMGKFGNCPIWILEGLAVLFESAFYDGEEVVIGLVPRDRLAALKRGIATGTLIPLTQLIRTPQPQFTGYHYAHAWGLIYMILYYGENKSVRKKTQQWFSDLFAASKLGPVTPEMVEERCGGRDKFLELEQQWIEWIRDLPYDFDPVSGR